MEEDYRSPESDEPIQGRLSADGAELKVVQRIVTLSPCHAINNARNKAHAEEDGKVVNYIPVKFSRDPRTLARSHASVEHDLRFLSSEDDNP